MKKTCITFFLFSLFFFTTFGSVKRDTLTIAVITDIHYLSSEFTEEGDALDAYERITGRNIQDLHEVLDKVLTNLIEEDVDILLVTGDITNHGEKLSHKEFIDKILPLTETGVGVYIIPGNHDINIPNAKNYIGDKAGHAENISKEEFTNLYKPMGFSNAISRDSCSLSYLAEIDQDTWLLAIDTNRYDEYDSGYISAGRIRQGTMQWILNILTEADNKGIRVLGMMHHGLIEHMSLQSTFFPEYLVEDWKENADMLAEAGLEIVFTGHFHSNDISLRTTASGKTIYDVQTASLSQFPFAYRIMKLSDRSISIDTKFITSIPGNENLEEEYKRKLESATRRAAVSKLKDLAIPMSEEMKKVLSDLIVKLNIAHVKGDEKEDPEIMSAVKSFALLLGNDTEEVDFSFDFPPEDNKLVIEFRSRYEKN